MAKNPEASSRGHDLHCEYDGCCVQLRPEDISQAGVFVGTTEAIALDRELALTLRSALGEIRVRGQVVQVISRSRAAKEHRNPGCSLPGSSPWSIAGDAAFERVYAR